MSETRERFIAVPKNDEGRHEYFRTTNSTENIAFYFLSEEEFLRIYDSGFLWEMNERFGLMLDDYESGRINSDFDYVLSEAEKVKDLCPTLYNAALQARDSKIEIRFAL